MGPADGPRRARRTTPRLAAALAAALCALPAASALAQPPDGRRYELVSPSAKLGNDVVAESSRTRAAGGEAPGLPMAAAFASLGGFADVQGMGVSTEYVAQRSGAPGTSGWTTHAITPPQAPLSLTAAIQGLDPLYEADMSADLTHGAFRAWSPLTPAPDVDGVANLYVREDLRTPGAGTYRLQSAAATPLPPLADGNDRPYFAGASRDFEHVIFESRLALTPDATAGNVMLYKADHGVVRLLAPGPTCPEGLVPSAPCSLAGAGATALRQTSRAISADGSRVVLASPVTEFGSSSTSQTAPSALYQLDDRGTAASADDVTLQVSASEKPAPDAPQPAHFESASSDGERVFFTSPEQLTDQPGSGLYLWQRTPPPGAGGRHLTLIVADPGAALLGASEDGHRAYFVTPGQLIPGGPPVSENGLYLWQDADGTPGGSLSFVGGIDFSDSDANDGAFPWNHGPSVARVTPDGRELLFEVSNGSGLAPQADHGSCAGRNANTVTNGRCSELYVYRADDSTPLAPDVVCASCDPSGATASANALVNVHDGSGASQVTSHLSRALTDDGRRVFFSSAQALVREDVNGRVDAYEYDVPSGTVSLISSGRDAADAWFLDASADGRDVFFVTREQLVGWDTDQSFDLYDARVDGGFPEPAVAVAPCAGEACRGVGHAAPAVAAVASQAFVGDGNRRRAAAKRCRRGLVKRKVHGKQRCVRRRAKKAHARRRARRGRR